MNKLQNFEHLKGEGGDVHRFIDREAGVVLYWNNRGTAGGMTAVPLAETNLEDA